MNTLHRLSAGLSIASMLVLAAGCAAPSEGETASESQEVNSKSGTAPIPTSGTFERRERLEMAPDGKSFLRMALDPASGEFFHAFPDNYAIEDGILHGPDYAHGSPNAKCGRIERDAEGASFSGECGFAVYYELSATEELVYERRERIDFVPEGFTRTILNPRTGTMLTALPEKFVVEGSDVFAAHRATFAKLEPCGKISVQDDTVTFEGCSLWSSYFRQD